MAQSKRTSRSREDREPRNGRANNSSKSKGKARRQQEYEETPDYASAFHRPDNDPPQPLYTGTGTLDSETLDAIRQADGEFQIAVWPRRARSGNKYLRIHIEPPWEGDDDDDDDEDDEFEDDDQDETPF